jgi:hypothetical protein
MLCFEFCNKELHGLKLKTFSGDFFSEWWFNRRPLRTETCLFKLFKSLQRKYKDKPEATSPYSSCRNTYKLVERGG